MYRTGSLEGMGEFCLFAFVNKAQGLSTALWSVESFTWVTGNKLTGPVFSVLEGN